MKRIVLSLIVLFATCTSLLAQEKKDKMIFNHLSVGVNFGTPGIGFDVATTCTPYLQFRAGVAFIPNVKFTQNVNIDYDRSSFEVQQIRELEYDLPNNIELKSKVGMVNGKFMIDVFPFSVRKFPFFISVGAYFGTNKLITVNNTADGVFRDVNRYNNDGHPYLDTPLGVKIGSEFFTPDAQGNAHASLNLSAFKPYVGIGFGRPVPLNKRVGFIGEIGAMFWGRPTVKLMDRTIVPEDLNNDVGDVLKIVKKFNVYPCINFRICGRIL